MLKDLIIFLINEIKKVSTATMFIYWIDRFEKSNERISKLINI